MKKELTVENVINCINEQDVYITPNSNYYNETMVSIVDYFYNNSTNVVISKTPPSFGGYVNISDENLSKEYFNINKITFNLFYPSIIVDLYKNNKIIFNITEFGEIYTFLYNNYKTIKLDKNLSENGNTVFNYIIYGLYGISCNKFNNYGFDNTNLLSEVTYNINKHIFETFKDDVIYIDTDIIYLKTINIELYKFLKTLPLKYEIENDINFCIFRKKCYISEESSIIYTHGISKNPARYNSYQKELDNFKNKLIILKRKKKIEKIKNGRYRNIKFSV